MQSGCSAGHITLPEDGVDVGIMSFTVEPHLIVKIGIGGGVKSGRGVLGVSFLHKLGVHVSGTLTRLDGDTPRHRTTPPMAAGDTLLGSVGEAESALGEQFGLRLRGTRLLH
jgi:hypothetical protein